MDLVQRGSGLAQTHYDVLILGGGIAACATAIALTALGAHYRIAIVEKHAPQECPARAEEILSPAAATALQALGLWQSFIALDLAQNRKVHSRWSQEDTQSDRDPGASWEPGWRLERPVFERWLLAAACARGVDYAAPWQLQQLERTATGWRVQLGRRVAPASAQPPQTDTESHHARLLIDASGRQASLATRLGAQRLRHDRLLMAQLIAPLASADSADREAVLGVEAIAHGWWYSALIHGQTLLDAPAPFGHRALRLCLMTDTDLARTLNLSHEAGWRDLLRAAPWTAQRILPAWRNPAPRIAAAHSQSLAPIAAAGWLAVGDAAGCLDPLASYGVLKALREAPLAAQACAEALAATTWSSAAELALQRYAERLKAQFSDALQQRRQAYAEVGRFAHLPFWQRRCGLAAARFS